MAFTSSNGRTQSSLADINITPLVDVVLVLLIIFMITAPVLQSGIDVAVPKTRSVKEITETRQVLTINRDQRVFLGDRQSTSQICRGSFAYPEAAIPARRSSISAPTSAFPSVPSLPSWTP